jgi:hypothetical protein
MLSTEQLDTKKEYENNERFKRQLGPSLESSAREWRLRKLHARHRATVCGATQPLGGGCVMCATSAVEQLLSRSSKNPEIHENTINFTVFSWLSGFGWLIRTIQSADTCNVCDRWS